MYTHRETGRKISSVRVPEQNQFVGLFQGESLSDEEKDKEEEDEEEEEKPEENDDDGFFVGHGVLGKDEIHPGKILSKSVTLTLITATRVWYQLERIWTENQNDAELVGPIN